VPFVPNHNIIPLIRCSRVSVLRACRQGFEASSTAAATDSRLLFVAKFLESGIGPQRFPDWIESYETPESWAGLGWHECLGCLAH
jgi:hypothetical protein